MKTRYHIILGVFFLLLLFSCKTHQTIGPTEYRGQNLSYLYNPGASTLHPRFMVYHNSESSTNLMVKVYPVELLFNQANEGGTYQAWLSIRYRSFELGANRVLVDSASLEFPLQMDGLKKEFVTNIGLNTEPTKKYLVEVVVMDRLRKTAVQSFIPIDRTTDYNSQNFMILNHRSRSVIFNPVVDSNMVFDVYFPKRTIDTLYVRYYKPDDRIPYAPNLLITSPTTLGDPDSAWIHPYWDSLGIQINKEGIYQYAIDSMAESGSNIYYFGQYYPSVKEPEQLIDPLVYLLSDNEIAEMKRQESAKIAVDDFWLKSAGEINRAKELIRVYYNRVLYANYFFSSFKEGWRTDRGMIYIIYGPPTGLYKTPSQEQWVYGEGESSISFVFQVVESPLSYNVYRLQRTDDLNSKWNQAVRSWRQGNIFILTND